MRFSAAFLLAGLSSITLAQNLLSQIPECAQKCFGDNIGTCGQFDIPCICGSDRIGPISCCVSQTCNADEQKRTIEFASGLCAANGKSVPTSASCASSSATASGSSSTPSASGTPAPTTASGGVAAQSSTQSTGAAAAPTAYAGGVGMGMAVVGLIAAL